MGFEGLDSERYVVDIDIRKARGLPPDAFTSKQFFARELTTVFMKNWQFVPWGDISGVRPLPYSSLGGRLKEVGAQLPFTALGEPLFLARGEDSVLRTFPNVCTHQWYPLVEKPRVAKRIVCSQHARVFDVGGKCLRQKGFDHCGNFPGSSDHLLELPTAEWHDFVFMAFERPRHSLETLLSPMRMSLSPRFPHDLVHVPRTNMWREVTGNWKLHVQNFLDHFHISTIHGSSLAQVVDMNSYRVEFNGSSVVQWVLAKEPAHGFPPQSLPLRFRGENELEQRVFAMWWFVFPNMAWNFYPWGLSLNAWYPVSHAPERTHFLWQHFVQDTEKYRRRNEWYGDELVDREDTDALALVANGVRSGFAGRQNFAPVKEAAAHWFQRMLSVAMFK